MGYEHIVKRQDAQGLKIDQNAETLAGMLAYQKNQDREIMELRKDVKNLVSTISDSNEKLREVILQNNTDLTAAIASSAKEAKDHCDSAVRAVGDKVASVDNKIDAHKSKLLYWSLGFVVTLVGIIIKLALF